jgi:hypothetical protein
MFAVQALQRCLSDVHTPGEHEGSEDVSLLGTLTPVQVPGVKYSQNAAAYCFTPLNSLTATA